MEFTIEVHKDIDNNDVNLLKYGTPIYKKTSTNQFIWDDETKSFIIDKICFAPVEKSNIIAYKPRNSDITHQREINFVKQHNETNSHTNLSHYETHNSLNYRNQSIADQHLTVLPSKLSPKTDEEYIFENMPLIRPKCPNKSIISKKKLGNKPFINTGVLKRRNIFYKTLDHIMDTIMSDNNLLSRWEMSFWFIIQLICIIFSIIDCIYNIVNPITGEDGLLKKIDSIFLASYIFIRIAFIIVFVAFCIVLLIRSSRIEKFSLRLTYAMVFIVFLTIELTFLYYRYGTFYAVRCIILNCLYLK